MRTVLPTRSGAAVLPVLLLGPFASSWAQAPLVGTYAVTIASRDVKAIPAPMASRMAGEWVVRFTADGRYEVRQNGNTHVTGTFVESGNQITLNDDGGDYACRGGTAPEGVYRVSLAHSTLTFTTVKDLQCPTRVRILTARPFHIVR